MPQAIAGYLIKLGLSKLVANVIAYVAYFAATYGASRALAKKAAGKFDGMPIDLTREPAPPRRVIYGRCRVGGPMLFAHLTGNKNRELHIIEAYAGHHVDAIEPTVYVDDETYPVALNGAVGGSLTGYMWSYWHHGFPGQQHDAVLHSFAPTIWTTAHDLQGTAYHYHRLKFSTDKWPYGLPNISAIVRGALLYDPRTGLTAYSDNPALCLRDYLTNSFYGMGVPAARIDDDSFVAAANICDELVAKAGGGTEKRYRCAAVFTMEIEPQEVIEGLLATMAGSIFYAGGKWRVYAGADRPVTRAAITEADLAGPVSIRTRDARGDTANRVKGKFSSPADNWAPVDFPAVSNALYLAEDQGEELWLDLDLTWVPSGSQAQRLAKIALERSRQDISVSLRGNLGLIDVQCGDVVPLTLARYGWAAKPFLVMGWSLEVDPNGVIYIDLELREYAAAMWAWNSGEETTVDPAPNTSLPDARTVADPTGVALFSGGALVSNAPDGTVYSAIEVTWTEVDDANVVSGGAIEIAWKRSADAQWNPAATIPGDSVRWILNGPVALQSYDVRLRAVNGLGVVGAWVQVLGHVTAGDTTPPAVPAGGVIFKDGIVPFFYPETKVSLFGFRVSWNPNTEIDFSHYEIKATKTNSDEADDLSYITWGQYDGRSTAVILYQGGPASFFPGHVRIRAVDRSGNASAWAYLGNGLTSLRIGSGTLYGQDSNDAEISGIQTGAVGAPSVRKVLARYPVSQTVVLAGGAPSEEFDISLANRGFSTLPDAGVLSSDDSLIDVLYWYGSGSSSSTNARCVVVSRSGANLAAGSRVIMGEFVEYD